MQKKRSNISKLLLVFGLLSLSCMFAYSDEKVMISGSTMEALLLCSSDMRGTNIDFKYYIISITENKTVITVEFRIDPVSVKTIRFSDSNTFEWRYWYDIQKRKIVKKEAIEDVEGWTEE